MEPTSSARIEANQRVVRKHYDSLFDLVDRAKSYQGDAFKQKPPIVNMGFWEHGAKTAREAQEQFVRELARRAPDLDGKQVLDIGCGLAGPGVLLASEYGANVDCINIVERQAGWANRYVEGNGLTGKIRVLVASAMAVPFADESFDVVFCLEAAHCFVDKRRFLIECHRVLRNDGTLLFADIVGTSHFPVVNWQPALKLNLITACDWEKMLEQSGFRVKEKKMIGDAVYPGCRWWAIQTAPEKRNSIFLKSCPGDASYLKTKWLRMRAAILELIYFRSVLLLMSRLRLRNFVLFAASRSQVHSASACDEREAYPPGNIVK